MWLSSWLQKRNSSGTGKRARHSSLKLAAFRPRLESLEGRDVPSTLTVTSVLDSGAGSLRDDITAAHSGDTIVFDPSLAGQQILLTSSELFINKNLSIQGLPARSVVSGAQSHSRVFDMAAGVSVTLTDLAIIDGTGIADAFNFDGSPTDGCGGGIYNAGTLTLHNCTVSGNSTAYSPGFGGGIYNAGWLTVTGSIVSGNSADYGGGIANFGTLAVSGGTVSDNSADFGGGIYSAYKLTATITGTTLSGNAAYTGGAIWNDGTMTLSGCYVDGNTATNAGGGIYNGKDGHLALQSATQVTGNSAPVGADLDVIGPVKISKDSTVGLISP